MNRTDGAALDELMPLVYDELGGSPAATLPRAAFTLQAEGIVNEAYVGAEGPEA